MSYFVKIYSPIYLENYIFLFDKYHKALDNVFYVIEVNTKTFIVSSQIAYNLLHKINLTQVL